MEETISLKEIFEVIKKRFIMIVGLVVVAALVAGIISYFILTPTYESSSQFIVNQSQENTSEAYDMNELRMNVEMINTYNVIIKSPAILDEVNEALNLSYTTEELSDKLEVSSEEDSQVVTVTATDKDPEMATELANTTVGIFEEEIPDIMNVDNVNILAVAETGEDPSPVAPRPLLNIAIAIVLGGMVGVGVAFLLEYLDNTIKTEDDIEEKLGLPVLGTITTITEEDVRTNRFKTHQQTGRGGGDYVSQKKSI